MRLCPQLAWWEDKILPWERESQITPSFRDLIFYVPSTKDRKGPWLQQAWLCCANQCTETHSCWKQFSIPCYRKTPPKARWSLTVLPWRPPKASSSVSRSYNSDSFEGEWIGSTNPKCSFIYNKSSHVFILANQQKKHNLGKRHWGQSCTVNTKLK